MCVCKAIWFNLFHCGMCSICKAFLSAKLLCHTFFSQMLSPMKLSDAPIISLPVTYIWLVRKIEGIKWQMKLSVLISETSYLVP